MEVIDWILTLLAFGAIASCLLWQFLLLVVDAARAFLRQLCARGYSWEYCQMPPLLCAVQ